MSFIKHRERMFHKRSRSISKKRSDTNLRRMSSCNDVRAWCLDADGQRQYFFDSINSQSSSFGKFIPPDVLIDILRKQNSSHLKKLKALKRTTSEEIIRKKPKELLVKKRSRLNFEQGDNENLKDSQEISNLRNMVKDMNSTFSTLKQLEEENSKLKSIINVNINESNDNNCQLVASNDNNCQLVASKDSLVPNNHQCNQLADRMSLMRDQCSKMRLDVEYLQSKNFKLSRKLKKTMSNERVLKDREFIVSMESINNAILKGKVESKEMKIQRLMNINEEQRHQIDILTSQINEMAVAFSWKEELLVGKLLELKNVLKTGSDKIIKYENRISLCHQVIKEMDLLSQQFRLVNTALKENAVCYKARLRVVGTKALDMAKKIDFLLHEISKRDEKINELSKFPGRTSMAIHLGQLDNILRGDFLYQTNKIAVVETFEKLKKILENLKTETWDNYGIDRPYLMNESSTQTQIEVKSRPTQHCARYTNNAIQTEYPDEYITKFITYCLFIEIFELTYKNLKKSLKTESHSNEYLRNIVGIYSEEIKSKNSELEIFRNCNKVLEDEIENLKKTINAGNQNLMIVTENYEFEEDSYNRLDNVYKSSSELTINEFENYCTLLESTIYNNEENIEQLTDYVENELYEQKLDHFQYFSKLENRYELLKTTLENQLRINALLNKEIKFLTKDLTSRDELIEKVTDLWYFAEDEIELLKESLQYQEITCCDRCCSLQSTGVQVIIEEEFESKPIEVELEPAPTEFGSCDSSMSVLNQPIESKLQSSISNCKKIRGIYHKNRTQEKILRVKLTKINIKVKRIATCMIKFKNKLEVSVLSLNKLKEINMELTDTNKMLHLDNIKLTERNYKLKESISLLKQSLKSEIAKTSQLQKAKVKLLKECQRLHLKIQDQIKESRTSSSNTEVVMHDYLEELESKDRFVNQLKSRVEKLVELLKDIELEKKVKEENMNSINLQTDLDEELKEKYIHMIREISTSYDQSFEKYKKMRDEEAENKKCYYRKNLLIVKNTYERDIKRMKKASEISLRKMQSLHVDEVKTLKEMINQLKSKPNEANLEQLRLGYDIKIKELNESIIKEKEGMQEKMKLYMHEKEQQVEEITKKMEVTLKQMKKKCKVQIRKIQQENNCTVEEMRKDQNNKSVDDLQSIDSDVYFRSSDKDYSVLESLDSEEIHNRSKGDDESLLHEFHESSRTVTSGFDEDMYDVPVGDERRYLIKRINLLEEQLSEKEKPSPENACDSEKRVWIERERCREVTQLLDKEIEKNESLKQKLNEEKQRTMQLDLANQALKKTIESLRQKNENNSLLDPFQINDKDQLINNKYEAILDDYEPISISDLSNSPSSKYSY